MAEYTMVKPPRRALAVWRIRALLLTFFPGFLCSLIFSFLSLGWLIATGIWIAVFFFGSAFAIVAPFCCRISGRVLLFPGFLCRRAQNDTGNSGKVGDNAAADKSIFF